MSSTRQTPARGVISALASPLFLGVIPILAKLAFAAGADVMAVVALRTLIAAALLWVAVLLFARHHIVTSTPAVLSSLLAGGINGVGSLFFYISLNRIDASLGQLVNISYLVFVTLFLRLAGHKISWLTLGRVLLAVLAIYILSRGGLGPPDWLGVGLMLLGALAYALQLVLSQRVLYDVPAPTFTLYALTAMAAVVSLAWLFTPAASRHMPAASWAPVAWMGAATLLSRLTLFLGVKHLGSMQTALLGMLEVLVTLAIAHTLLAERLTWLQWLGAGIILLSVLLVRFERDVPRFIDWWAAIYTRLRWPPH